MRGNYLLKIMFVFLIILIFNSFASAVYVGITDGYIKDPDDNAVEGASVNVVVQNCFGEGCSKTVLSQKDGYYIATNLNLPKNGNVLVSATKSGFRGSANGISDQYHVAHINVYFCLNPSAPKITPVQDSHNSLVNFIWTSGNDPKGKETFDELRIDTGALQRSIRSPYPLAMSFGNHSWQVRTCNLVCCSQWVRDSFFIWNKAPSEPVVQTSHESGIISVSWISGKDSDGDLIYDEFLEEGKEIISPAISPRLAPSQILYQYKVRTCDSFKFCSQWVNASYVTCEEVNTSCPGYGDLEAIQKRLDNTYILKSPSNIEIYCNGLRINNLTVEKLNLITPFSGEEIEVEVYSQKGVLKDISYCPWCYNQEKDYDEEAIDCGGIGCGSCEKSSLKEIIKRTFRNIISWIILLLILIIILISIGYYYYKKRHGKYSLI